MSLDFGLVGAAIGLRGVHGVGHFTLHKIGHFHFRRTFIASVEFKLIVCNGQVPTSYLLSVSSFVHLVFFHYLLYVFSDLGLSGNRLSPVL